MPATRGQRLAVLARAWLPWRKLFGNRTVRRTVQGVELFMPWSHVLPDYARARPTYGQNLVELAAAITRHKPSAASPLRVLDIGANIGDSALQILNRTDARVLCVEADPYWNRYLRMNVGSDSRITLEEVLLLAADDGSPSRKAVRHMGTTSFEEAEEQQTTPTGLSVAELRRRNPEFERIGLIKSDTDGFDAALIPATAREWQASKPLVFFEFDPRLARLVGNDDPHRVWAELAELGYTQLAIWDNTGDALGRLETDQAAAQAARIDPAPSALGYQFWDVAACRGDDHEGRAALDDVLSVPFALGGHGR